MIQSLDSGFVSLAACKGTKGKKLVQRAGPAIGIAADQIVIVLLKISRRDGAPGDDALTQIGEMVEQDRFDPVSKGFAQGRGPAPVRGHVDQPGSNAPELA